MTVYYAIVFFVFGTVLGSFYNVVGDRLPNGESIIKPSSHCPKCGHKLKPLELIPIFSFIFQKGKCKQCGLKIDMFHPLFELASGLLFTLAYLIFGLNTQLIIVLTFISILLIVFVSDIKYMIIPDEILIIGIFLLFLESLFLEGILSTMYSLLDGVIAFLVMFSLKKIGDFLFKRESMGGGDIKLMFLFGFVLTWPMSLLSIFLGSIIGLPISLLFISKNSSHEVPFGPLLSMGALIILFFQLNLDKIINIYK